MGISSGAEELDETKEYINHAKAAVLDHLYGQVALTAVAVTLFGMVFLWALELYQRPVVFWTTASLVALNQLARLLVAHRFSKVSQEQKAGDPRWGLYWDATVCVTSLTFCGAAITGNHNSDQVALYETGMLLAVLAGTGLPVVSRSLVSMMVYVSAPMLTMAALFAVANDWEGVVIGFVSLLFMIRFGIYLNRHYTASLISSARYFAEKRRAEIAAGRAADAAFEKTRFVHAASHDLRQPLQVISIYAELLDGQNIGEENERIIHGIKGASKTLEDLAASILDHARSEHNQVVPEIRAVRINDLFSRLKMDALHLAAQNQNSIHIRDTRY